MNGRLEGKPVPMNQSRARAPERLQHLKAFKPSKEFRPDATNYYLDAFAFCMALNDWSDPPASAGEILC